MAKQDQPESVPEVPAVVGYNPDDYEWTTVHEEAPDQIVFDTVGDKYIGEYLGHEVIDPHDEKDPDKRFIQLRFRDPEGLKVTNAGYELRETYVEILSVDGGEWKTRDRIPPGTLCHNELKKLVQVDQASPMKSFRVNTAPKRGNADNKR